MTYSSRLWLYGPFALLALIAVAVCGSWYVTANALSAKFAKLNGREAMPGVTLRYTPPEMGGFPFRVDAVFKDFRVRVEDKAGPIEWRAEHFALHRLTYGEQTIFEAAGKQTLRWSDAKGEKQEMSFTPAKMQASAIEDKIGLMRFDLDIAGMNSADVRALRFQFHIRRDPKADLLNVVVKSDRLSPSPKLQSLLGETIRASGFKGDVIQGDAFDGLRAGKESWIAAQDRWRAKGGTVRSTK